jgi:hypothetical protein
MVAFKGQLVARFKMTDRGDLSQLLGMYITRERTARTISMARSNYVTDIMIEHHVTDCKPLSLPMDPDFMSGFAHLDSPLLIGAAKEFPLAYEAASRTRACAHIRMFLKH